jgi:Protein of unknown function (DUF732)
MKGTRLAAGVAMAAPILVGAIALATPAQADDYDAPFNAQLHTYGIYGPQDYNAWLGKIACERLQRGVDTDAYKSATFIQHNLALHTTEGQSFQFLGAAVDHYCPDQIGVVQRAGAH